MDIEHDDELKQVRDDSAPLFEAIVGVAWRSGQLRTDLARIHTGSSTSTATSTCSPPTPVARTAARRRPEKVAYAPAR
jgi:hypothetical protein